MGLNWGKLVKVKQNIAEVLETELRRRPAGVVGLGTTCDPYQPAEAKFELTRKCIELLSFRNLSVCIQTKSSLILRDMDVIKPDGFEVGVTITTMNRKLAEKLEPNASPPEARARILEEFSSSGVRTWLFLGPIIPGVNDSQENFKQIVEVAKSTNSYLIYDKLNLRRWVLHRLGSFLDREYPGMKEQIPALLASGSGYWKKICTNIESICEAFEVECEPAF